jgi:hypothetical protein
MSSSSSLPAGIFLPCGRAKIIRSEAAAQSDAKNEKKQHFRPVSRDSNRVQVAAWLLLRGADGAADRTRRRSVEGFRPPRQEALRP